VRVRMEKRAVRRQIIEHDAREVQRTGVVCPRVRRGPGFCTQWSGWPSTEFGPYWSGTKVTQLQAFFVSTKIEFSSSPSVHNPLSESSPFGFESNPSCLTLRRARIFCSAKLRGIASRAQALVDRMDAQQRAGRGNPPASQDIPHRKT
jgi:hypothetical protein